LIVLAATAPAALAAPATVTLRVEGATSTIFEGPVTTDGHDVTTAAGGTHKCDGTNGNPPVNPTPGPSATAALDDAGKLGGFDFDGAYSVGFDDFLISRVGPDSQTQTQFWSFAVNGQFPEIGGCQQRVAHGDEVLWAFDSFGKALLKLTGPAAVRTNTPFAVQVKDAADGSNEAGASVGGATTGADGRATLNFALPGIYRLKATRANAIRSNALVVCVDPAPAVPCTSTDDTAPQVLGLTLPGNFASTRARSRTITVSWQANDGETGSGVAGAALEVADVASGAGAAQAPVWRTVASGIGLTSARFRGGPGRAYRFRVRAIDRALNVGSAESGVLTFPVDDRDRSLLRFSRGWRRLTRNGAWGRQLMHSVRRGASAQMTFRGGRVAIIGRRLRDGGRLRVAIDGGRGRTVRVRGARIHRRVLFLSRRLSPGAHTLRLTAAGGGPVEIDAVVPVP
jgi:hypothetical protein